MSAKIQPLPILKNGKKFPVGGVRALLDEIHTLRQKLRHQEVMINMLEKQSVQDPLTGLLNKRGFDTALSKAFSILERHNRNSALLMIDMNQFKPINDTFGHQTGDEVLIHIAKLLQKYTRSTDVVARIGGDEFCIILSEITKPDAIRKKKKIELLIAAHPYQKGVNMISLSASIGLSMLTEGATQEDIFRKADMQMYRHKEICRQS